jgi:hypothetical protein
LSKGILCSCCGKAAPDGIFIPVPGSVIIGRNYHLECLKNKSGSLLPYCIICHQDQQFNMTFVRIVDHDEIKIPIHEQCRRKTCCSECGLKSINRVRFEVGCPPSFFHSESCTKNCCRFCNEVIGRDKFKTLPSGKSHHLVCMEHVACIVCTNKMGDDSVPVEEENGFRHFNCTTVLCSGCNQLVASVHATIVSGESYHETCIPACSICFDNADPLNGPVVRHEDGHFYHPTCSADECPICYKVLGRASDVVTWEGKSIHRTCLFACKCGKSNPCYWNRPKEPVVHPKNFPFLKKHQKMKCLAFYGAMKNIRIPLRSGKSVLQEARLPRDVVRFMMNLYASDREFAHGTILPFIDNGTTDLRDYCVFTRCSKSKCAGCGDPSPWNTQDFCGFGVCKLIRKFQVKIICEVYGKPRWSIREASLWQVEVLMDTLFLQEAANLTEKQLLLISGYRDAMRRIAERQDSFNKISK